MPVIDTIEVATGGYPKVGDVKRCIFIITEGGYDDYVMVYDKDRLADLGYHWEKGTKLSFTKDGNKTDARAIIVNETRSTNPETDPSHTFVGATEYKTID